MTDNQTAVLSRKKAWLLALAATLTMAVSYVDRQTLSVLAPSVCKDLNISDTEYGWLASAFSMAYLVGAPLAGRLIDRVGARRGLLGAVLVWSLVAAAHALVPGFASLFMLRIALGFAEAPSFPGAAQTVHRALPKEERARGFGVLFTGSSFGAMVAAPLAATLESVAGWRVAFLVTTAVGLIWVPTWFLLAFSKDARKVLDTPEPSPHAAPVVRDSTWTILKHRAVLRALLVVLASAPLIGFILLWSSKVLVKNHALTQAEVGHYLWLPPLVFDVGAVAFGHLASARAKKRGHVNAAENGLLLAAMVLGVALVAVRWSHDAWTTTALLGVAMAGGGGLYALFTADMLSRVPPSAVSTAGGITAAAQSLTYIVANPLIGMSVESSGSYSTVLLALGVWVIPGCLGWILWRPPAAFGEVEPER